MPQRAQRGHSKVPPQLRKWLEKWFCAHKIPKKVPRTIFLGPGAGKHAFEPLGQGKWVRETFMEFLCAQKNQGTAQAPRGVKIEGIRPLHVGNCFLVSPMCLGCAKWVYQVPGASGSNINTPKRAKRAKTGQNRPKSIVSRARAPKKQNLGRKGIYLGQKSTSGAHIMRSERFTSSEAVSVAGSAPSTQ